MTTKVYLAGGMQSGWQDLVIKRALPFAWDVEYIDPRTHNLTSEKEYTAWDLQGIQDCDILFACMEHDNPSGFGMMLELGYASGIGKNIVFVELGNDCRAKSYGMARQVAGFYTTSMDEACAYLFGMLSARSAML